MTAQDGNGGSAYARAPMSPSPSSASGSPLSPCAWPRKSTTGEGLSAYTGFASCASFTAIAAASGMSSCAAIGAEELRIFQHDPLALNKKERKGASSIAASQARGAGAAAAAAAAAAAPASRDHRCAAAAAAAAAAQAIFTWLTVSGLYRAPKEGGLIIDEGAWLTVLSW